MAVKRSDARKNRAHLLAVARDMVQEGDSAPSFNELAKQAGVGVGTVYRHFADHDALLAGLVEAQLADLEALMARVGAEKDPAAALELLLRSAIALQLDSPVMAQILAAPRRVGQKVARRLAALEAMAESIVARGRRAKLIRADVKAGDLRRLVCGIERAARAGDEPAEAASRYLEIVLAGLRRR
jgi:AcrR family transcriptional regulator